MADKATALTLEMNFLVNINLTFDSRGLKKTDKKLLLICRIQQGTQSRVKLTFDE